METEQDGHNAVIVVNFYYPRFEEAMLNYIPSSQI